MKQKAETPIKAYCSRLSMVAALALMLVTGACSGRARSAANEGIITNEPMSATSTLASLEDQGQLPDFSLIDQHGRKVTPADLKGRVWVADFFFTHCKGACPMMTTHMAQLQQSLASSGLRLVSITVDPDRDTPAMLADYARHMGAKDESWLFLTGEKSRIIDLSVNGFHLSASADPSTHSQRLILIDRDGHIRGYYRNDEASDIDLLKRNAEILLKAEK